MEVYPIFTVTRSTPESFAPTHNPVDIPPHPEYRSSNANCGLED